MNPPFPPYGTQLPAFSMRPGMPGAPMPPISMFPPQGGPVPPFFPPGVPPVMMGMPPMPAQRSSSASVITKPPVSATPAPLPGPPSVVPPMMSSMMSPPFPPPAFPMSTVSPPPTAQPLPSQFSTASGQAETTKGTTTSLPPSSRQPSVTVYVGKIPSTVEDEFLKSLLERCGPVRNWRRVSDPVSGTPKAFGFCDYIGPSGAYRAMRVLGDVEIDDQKLLMKVDDKTQKILDDYAAELIAERNFMAEIQESQDDASRPPGLEVEAENLDDKDNEEITQLRGEIEKAVQERALGRHLPEDPKAAAEGLESQMLSEMAKGCRYGLFPTGQNRNVVAEEIIKFREREAAREVERRRIQLERERGREKAAKEGTVEMDAKDKGNADGGPARVLSASPSHDKKVSSKDVMKRREEALDKKERERRRRQREQTLEREKKRKEQAERIFLEREREYEERERFRENLRRRRDGDNSGSQFHAEKRIKLTSVESTAQQSTLERTDVDTPHEVKSGSIGSAVSEEFEVQTKLDELHRMQEEQEDQAAVSRAEHLGQSLSREEHVGQYGTFVALPEDAPPEPEAGEILEEKKNLGFSFGMRRRVGPTAGFAEDEAILDGSGGSVRKHRVLTKLEPDRRAPPRPENLQALVDSVPTDREKLFGYEIDWAVVDDNEIPQKKMKPWIVKRIVEYLGEEERSLIDFIVKKITEHTNPLEILDELSVVLDEEADLFVIKMWRILERMNFDEADVEVSEFEMELDDSLSPVEKISSYLSSSVASHRLWVIRDIGIEGREVGIEVAIDHFVPALEKACNDDDVKVRQCAVEQIPELSAFFIESGSMEASQKALNVLVPLVFKLATDNNINIRSSAAEALISLGKMFGQEDLVVYILPLVESLANSQSEDHRLESVHIMGSLTPVLGKEACENVVFSQVERLSRDPVFRVRKAVAANMTNICEVMDKDFVVEKLLPVFENLSKDSIWGVRQASLDSIVALAGNVNTAERSEILIPMFQKLAGDVSRWVRNSASKKMGLFVSQLSGDEVTPELLQTYINMASDTSSEFCDMEIRLSCALSFTDILKVVGPQRWEELKAVFFLLVNDVQYKVRQVISSSLHVVASILGTEIAMSSLLPTFELFLRDLDEVSEGVIHHIDIFLGTLSIDAREKYQPVLLELCSHSKWRIRKLVARQLGGLSNLYSAPGIEPLFLQLLSDPVSSIRRACCKCAGQIMLSLAGRQEDGHRLVETINGYSTDQSWFNRQLFVFMCIYLLRDWSAQIFESIFLPLLLNLQCDPVPNVRLCVARVLRSDFQNYGNLSQREDVISALARLRADSDRDVREMAGSERTEKAALSDDDPEEMARSERTEKAALGDRDPEEMAGSEKAALGDDDPS